MARRKRPRDRDPRGDKWIVWSESKHNPVTLIRKHIGDDSHQETRALKDAPKENDSVWEKIRRKKKAANPKP